MRSVYSKITRNNGFPYINRKEPISEICHLNIIIHEELKKKSNSQQNESRAGWTIVSVIDI